MVLVTIFVTCPFVVRELVPMMLSRGSRRRGRHSAGGVRLANVPPRDAAQHSLGAAVRRGADQRARHRRVRRGVGGVRFDSRRNYSLPLQVELLQQDYNTVGAFTAAALLTLMAIVTLFLKSALQWRLERQNARLEREENHEH